MQAGKARAAAFTHGYGMLIKISLNRWMDGWMDG